MIKLFSKYCLALALSNTFNYISCQAKRREHSKRLTALCHTGVEVRINKTFLFLPLKLGMH